MISCLVIALLVSASTVAGDRPSPSVHEFNVEVEQAVIAGEAWPCNPMLLAARLLQADLPAGLMIGRGGCRSGDGDSVANVTVRGKETFLGKEPVWLRVKFICLADSTWRLVAVDTLEAEINPPLPYELALLRTPPPENAFVIKQKRVSSLPVGDGGVRYSSTVNGLTFELKHLSYLPRNCVVPDSTIPVSVYCSPFPDSNPQVRIAVFETSDLGFEIGGDCLESNGAVSISGVSPGFYWVRLSGSALKRPKCRIRVLWRGEPVGEPLEMFLF